MVAVGAVIHDLIGLAFELIATDGATDEDSLEHGTTDHQNNGQNNHGPVEGREITQDLNGVDDHTGKHNAVGNLVELLNAVFGQQIFF